MSRWTARCLPRAFYGGGFETAAAFYDCLIKYQALISMDNAALTTHAVTFLAKSVITAGASPDYGEGWSFVWLPL